MSETQSDQGKGTINLKIQLSKDGTQTYFKIKRSVKMHKLMDAFCTKHSVDPNTIQFIFDGVRINKNMTPDQIGLQDEDEIEAMVHADGGSMIVKD